MRNVRALIVCAATMLAPLALVAQRGAVHFPGGGHATAGPAMRSGQPSHSSSRPTVGTRMIGSQPVRTTARANQKGIWTSAGFVPTQSGQVSRYGHEHHRGGDRSGYGYGNVGYPAFGYSYGYLNGLNGGLNLDDNDPNDPNLQPSGNSVDAPAYYGDNTPPPYGDAEGYGYGPGIPDPRDTARAPYASSTSSNAVSNGLNHLAVTLVFKDRRPPLQIENYAITQNKIFVRDRGIDRDIPLADLDIPATQAANDQAGVDFSLPAEP